MHQLPKIGLKDNYEYTYESHILNENILSCIKTKIRVDDWKRLTNLILEQQFLVELVQFVVWLVEIRNWSSIKGYCHLIHFYLSTDSRT